MNGNAASLTRVSLLSSLLVTVHCYSTPPLCVCVCPPARARVCFGVVFGKYGVVGLTMRTREYPSRHVPPNAEADASKSCGSGIRPAWSQERKPKQGGMFVYVAYRRQNKRRQHPCRFFAFPFATPGRYFLFEETSCSPSSSKLPSSYSRWKIQKDTLRKMEPATPCGQNETQNCSMQPKDYQRSQPLRANHRP